MAKKYYSNKGSSFGMVKNNFSNMPQEVMIKEISKNDFAISEGGYCDNMEMIDQKRSSNLSQIRKGMKK